MSAKLSKLARRRVASANALAGVEKRKRQNEEQQQNEQPPYVCPNCPIKDEQIAALQGENGRLTDRVRVVEEELKAQQDRLNEMSAAESERFKVEYGRLSEESVKLQSENEILRDRIAEMEESESLMLSGSLSDLRSPPPAPSEQPMRPAHLTMYSCKACDYLLITTPDFESNTRLDAHIREVHLHWCPYECIYCEKKAVSKLYLHSHVTKDHPRRKFKVLYNPDKLKEKQLSLLKEYGNVSDQYGNSIPLPHKGSQQALFESRTKGSVFRETPSDEHETRRMGSRISTRSVSLRTVPPSEVEVIEVEPPDITEIPHEVFDVEPPPAVPSETQEIPQGSSELSAEVRDVTVKQEPLEEIRLESDPETSMSVFIDDHPTPSPSPRKSPGPTIQRGDEMSNTEHEMSNNDGSESRTGSHNDGSASRPGSHDARPPSTRKSGVGDNTSMQGGKKVVNLCLQFQTESLDGESTAKTLEEKEKLWVRVFSATLKEAYYRARQVNQKERHCRMCRTSVTWKEVKDHVRAHVRLNIYKCPTPFTVCSFVGANAAELRQHIYEKHPVRLLAEFDQSPINHRRRFIKLFDIFLQNCFTIYSSIAKITSIDGTASNNLFIRSLSFLNFSPLPRTRTSIPGVRVFPTSGMKSPALVRSSQGRSYSARSIARKEPNRRNASASPNRNHNQVPKTVIADWLSRSLGAIETDIIFESEDLQLNNSTTVSMNKDSVDPPPAKLPKIASDSAFETCNLKRMNSNSNIRCVPESPILPNLRVRQQPQEENCFDVIKNRVDDAFEKASICATLANEVLANKELGTACIKEEIGEPGLVTSTPTVVEMEVDQQADMEVGDPTTSNAFSAPLEEPQQLPVLAADLLTEAVHAVMKTEPVEESPTRLTHSPPEGLTSLLPNEMIQCSLCSWSTKGPKNGAVARYFMKKHIFISHIQKPVVKCPYKQGTCAHFSFFDPENIKNHIQTAHRGARPRLPVIDARSSHEAEYKEWRSRCFGSSFESKFDDASGNTDSAMPTRKQRLLTDEFTDEEEQKMDRSESPYLRAEDSDSDYNPSEQPKKKSPNKNRTKGRKPVKVYCAVCKTFIVTGTTPHIYIQHLNEQLISCPFKGCNRTDKYSVHNVDQHIKLTHFNEPYKPPIDNKGLFQDVYEMWKKRCFGKNGKHRNSHPDTPDPESHNNHDEVEENAETQGEKAKATFSEKDPSSSSLCRLCNKYVKVKTPHVYSKHVLKPLFRCPFSPCEAYSTFHSSSLKLHAYNKHPESRKHPKPLIDDRNLYYEEYRLWKVKCFGENSRVRNRYGVTTNVENLNSDDKEKTTAVLPDIIAEHEAQNDQNDLASTSSGETGDGSLSINDGLIYKTYKCRMCQMAVGRIETHIYFAHLKKPVVRCPYGGCDYYDCFQKCNVKTHMKMKHPNEPYKEPRNLKHLYKDEVAQWRIKCFGSFLPVRPRRLKRTDPPEKKKKGRPITNPARGSLRCNLCEIELRCPITMTHAMVAKQHIFVVHINKPTVKCPFDGCTKTDVYFTHNIRKHMQLVHLGHPHAEVINEKDRYTAELERYQKICFGYGSETGIYDSNYVDKVKEAYLMRKSVAKKKAESVDVMEAVRNAPPRSDLDTTCKICSKCPHKEVCKVEEYGLEEMRAHITKTHPDSFSNRSEPIDRSNEYEKEVDAYKHKCFNVSGEMRKRTREKLFGKEYAERKGTYLQPSLATKKTEEHHYTLSKPGIPIPVEGYVDVTKAQREAEATSSPPQPVVNSQRLKLVSNKE